MNTGLDGIVLSWVNYHDEMRQWVSEVMPLIEQPVCESPIHHKPSKGTRRNQYLRPRTVSNGSGPLRDHRYRLGRAERSPWLVKRASGYKARRLDLDAEALMNPFWSQIARELSPYVPVSSRASLIW